MSDAKLKLLLLNPQPRLQTEAARYAEKYSFQIEAVATADLGGKWPKSHVLLLPDFSPGSCEIVTQIRARKEGKVLPVLVALADEVITPPIIDAANKLQVEVVPSSTPLTRRWQRLREAAERHHAGKTRKVVNRRQHFRLPLQVKATVMEPVQTVDVSLGGVGFISSRRFRMGERGLIDIRSLLGDMEEDARGFRFEVVSVRALLDEPNGGYLIGAKFVELAPEALQRLKDALEVVEPTAEER